MTCGSGMTDYTTAVTPASPDVSWWEHHHHHHRHHLHHHLHHHVLPLSACRQPVSVASHLEDLAAALPPLDSARERLGRTVSVHSSDVRPCHENCSLGGGTTLGGRGWLNVAPKRCSQGFVICELWMAWVSWHPRRRWQFDHSTSPGCGQCVQRSNGNHGYNHIDKVFTKDVSHWRCQVLST